MPKVTDVGCNSDAAWGDEMSEEEYDALEEAFWRDKERQGSQRASPWDVLSAAGLGVVAAIALSVAGSHFRRRILR